MLGGRQTDCLLLLLLLSQRRRPSTRHRPSHHALVPQSRGQRSEVDQPLAAQAIGLVGRRGR